jgi:phosphatidylserine/phosphatidylglycerophosphate/cardiolipin synthase-like enzyme
MKKLALTAVLGLLVACSAEVDPEQPVVSDPPVTSADPGTPGTPDPDKVDPAPDPAAPACEPLSPRNKPLVLAVQPEESAAPFVAVIEAAKTDIRVMVYQMGFGPVLEGLEAKAKAGVKVRVILDYAQKDVNQKYMDRLKLAGADVIWSDTQWTYMHAKLIIADESEAVISTGNYYIGSIDKERNFAVRDSDPADLKVLGAIFDADFERKTPDVSCTRLLVSPINAKQRLLDFIASAKTEVLVHSMQLGDRDVRDALVAAKKKGVAVRALVADPGWIDANAAAATFLAANGIESRWRTHVHTKTITVDGAASYIGSINLSWTSLTKNREIGLIMTEPQNVATVAATFEKDWTTANAF